MTLKQAFTAWSLVPSNIVLSAKSRDAVNKVLMKKYSDVSLENFTFSLAKRIITQSTETKELKVKVFALLVNLMKWGNEQGYCNYPEFDYNIVSFIEEQVGKNDIKEENINKEQKQENTSPMKEPIRVCQIDPETLQVVNTYESLCAAQRALGMTNLGRSLRKKTLATGYYWATSEGAKSFQPSEKKTKTNTDKKEEDKIEYPPTTHTAGVVCSKQDGSVEYFNIKSINLSDDALIAELKRRGFKGQITKTFVL